MINLPVGKTVLIKCDISSYLDIIVGYRTYSFSSNDSHLKIGDTIIFYHPGIPCYDDKIYVITDLLGNSNDGFSIKFKEFKNEI